jgi:hypothetical protein
MATTPALGDNDANHYKYPYNKPIPLLTAVCHIVLELEDNFLGNAILN